jgi:uncharacterized damage-inducible protein DinB
MKKSAALALLACPAALFGQSSTQMAKDMLVKRWTIARDFTVDVAQAMPADSYGFRPNQEQMSYGQLMAHIGIANAGNCALVAGTKAPAPPEKVAAGRKDPIAIDKDTAIKYLQDTFQFCLDTIPTITSEQLMGMTGPEGRQLSGFERLWSYFTHTAHHRGQAEVYLRVKNIKPPAYRF